MEAAEQSGSVPQSPSLPVQAATLRQLSTELQREWIERLFSRFAALYGAAFGRQWEGTNLSEVKAVWAEKLGGFNAHQIGEALKACEEKPYPPNLPEFLELCRRALKRETPLPAIESPQLSTDEIAQRQQKIASVATKTDGYDYRAWCKEIKRRYLAGEFLYSMQIEMASEVMGEVWEKGQCKPKATTS